MVGGFQESLTGVLDGQSGAWDVGNLGGILTGQEMSGPQSQICQVGDDREVTRALGDPEGVCGRSPSVDN